MKDSGYAHTETVLTNRAAGYERTPTGLKNARYYDMSIPFSAGALYSGAQDLYLWDRALYTERLLRAALRDLLFTPNLEDYGYGWAILIPGAGFPYAGESIPMHGGAILGFQSLIQRIPSHSELIVLLDNTDSPKRGHRAVDAAKGRQRRRRGFPDRGAQSQAATGSAISSIGIDVPSFRLCNRSRPASWGPSERHKSAQATQNAHMSRRFMGYLLIPLSEMAIKEFYDHVVAIARFGHIGIIEESMKQRGERLGTGNDRRCTSIARIFVWAYIYIWKSTPLILTSPPFCSNRLQFCATRTRTVVEREMKTAGQDANWKVWLLR